MVHVHRALLATGHKVEFQFGMLGRCSAVVDLTPATILFACEDNAGRSQMAEALFNALANPASATAVSAGTRPGPAVHDEVLAVMAEIGIDLSGTHPTLLTDRLVASATMLVTMGCGEGCPVAPGVELLDWEIPDPNGRPVDEVRAIREQVRERVVDLIAPRGWQR